MNQKFIIYKPDKFIDNNKQNKIQSKKHKLSGLVQNNKSTIQSQKQISTIQNPTFISLFKIQLQMRERDIETRLDIKYPYTKLDKEGNLLERQESPPLFTIEFQYIKTNLPIFKIYAVRASNIEESYEIDIKGQKNIKNVMKRFDNEYMMIVDNLRIMGDALVLLNPISKT